MWIGDFEIQVMSYVKLGKVALWDFKALILKLN
jgi:hypothetical protein